ncbi:phosphotransferase [Nocardia sp. CDC159]|uniref:Phosphotransferase n=1 Tax=Nocardia pulmonis TaxID=2951408 RepID=A0A9X2E597_9NOCA|nr:MULTISPECIES: phosphotransferase [Nocardia]MCM6774479.1 phosphotransferase [Nocardia pulmonis]MCM6787455.1 phosphotransferase [Nocardia sp. CDC159]
MIKARRGHLGARNWLALDTSEHDDGVVTNEERAADRIGWDQLPAPVRAVIEHRLGAPVRAVTVPPGGYSHGMAALLHLGDGRTVFAKAINSDDALADRYRTEAHTVTQLPRTVPTPAIMFSAEIAGWIVAVFDAVAGRHPRLDRPGELAAVLEAVERLAAALTPSPLPDTPTIVQDYGPVLTGWRGFAENGPPADLDPWSRRHLDRLAELESTWSVGAVGETLLHTDLRPDNMLLRDDGSVVVVDWAWPCRGAAWVDTASLVPSMLAAGVDPDPILATHPVTAGTDPAAIDAFVCALAGYWAHNSRLPAPPRSPSLRQHQARKAHLTTTWMTRRLSWP